MAVTTASYPNRVSALFTDKTILITGGTGFLGKVLIEKLLRSCDSLKKIYVIVRPKKDASVDQRLEKIFRDPLFDRVKQQHGPLVIKKVEAVCGDVGAADLGLSVSDRRKLVQEIEIIYHSAATIRFDDTLKFTVLLNVRGTRSLLELAKVCRNLQVFVHISTAFCYENESVVSEEFYQPHANPHYVIKLCERLDDTVLERKANEIRGVSVNNYSFSKALAEALINEHKDTLPVIIQRPTVVVSTWKEPVPGWTDNLNGMMGLFVAGGKGVFRTMWAKADAFVDCSSVDMAINKIIVNTYHYCTYRNQQVFNVVGPEQLQKFTPQQVADEFLDCNRHKVPFNMVLWYPNISIKSSRIYHYFELLLFQLFPALLIDTILYITGNKPFLVKVQKRIFKGTELVNYYMNRTWNFKDSSKSIRDLLNPLENEVFDTNFDSFDMKDYATKAILGCRRYILKERDDDIPAALKRMKMLEYLDFLCKLAFMVGICYYFGGKMLSVFVKI